MNRSSISVFLVALSLALAPRTTPAQAAALVAEPRAAAHADAIDSARAAIRSWMAEKNLPGVSVAVGLDGELAWAEGFGWADLEQHVAVSPLTKFRIGSVSKPIAAVAAGLLVERGRLDLDAPVQRYVPGFAAKRWPVTTRQVMGHVAGIRHYANGEEVFSSKPYADVVAALEIFADDSLVFRPGTRYGYSSYGYNLVSAVVQGAAGEPFLDFVRREVLAPIGMRHTVPDDVNMIVPYRASFYVRDSTGQLLNARYVDQSNKWAGGGFLSTPSDLVRFGYAMLGAELLKRGSVAQQWTRQRLESGDSTSYGLGWQVTTAPATFGSLAGSRMVGHGGSSVGGTTQFLIFADRRLVVAVTSNVSGAETGPLAAMLARVFGAAPAH